MPKCILSGQVKSTFTQEQADGRYVPLSRTINNKPLSSNITLSASDVSAATESYVDSKLPIGRTVTLSSSAWSSNSQTATVEGVNANTTGQIIDWGAHDQTSYAALASAQLFISASTSPNQLVFTALGDVPTSNVQIDIRIQEAQGV